MSYFKSKETEKRYSIFPILHQDIWDFYKKVTKQHWEAQEVDLSQDNYEELDVPEKLFLDNMLSFFNVSDSLVITNLEETLLKETNIEEAQFFYRYQTFNESVHQEMYSLMTDTYIKDIDKKLQMFDSVKYNPVVREKTMWVEKWINNASFPHKLVAFACVEGISFSSLFAGAFWFRTRNKIPGFGAANELILKDESSHYEFAKYMYNNYLKEEYKLSNNELRDIILGAYNTEVTFVENSLPDGLKGLTKENMIKYVQFVTDIVLRDFGLELEFRIKNPLTYMANIGLESKNNFFEIRTGDYTRVEIPKEGINFNEDF